jgi:hypothetical protein
LVLRGLLGKGAEWRARVGDEAYQASIAEWEDLLGDHTPYPHAAYSDSDPEAIGRKLREDEAWWRQALGDQHGEVLAYRTALDTLDGRVRTSPPSAVLFGR